jgi:GNAT superfamily N-acetyltransferase
VTSASIAVPKIEIVNTLPEHFTGIEALTRRIYPGSPPWTAVQLQSHLDVFPGGQFVAVESGNNRVVGMAASLIVLWDDYEVGDNWRDFTDLGMFTNHDREHGRTLYGAEVMVDPALQGHGVGSRLYDRRRKLVEDLELLRIRAGSRLRGFHRYAGVLTPQEYVRRVEAGDVRDPTLSFQLHRGFNVLKVVSGYLQHDPESLGHAAVIEWINRVARQSGPLPPL